MRTMWKSFVAMGALVALVGCENNRQQQQEPGETGMGQEAGQIGRDVEGGARQLGQEAEQTGEQAQQQVGGEMQQQAGQEQGGVTYEVVRVDRQNQQVILSRAKVGELGAPEGAGGQRQMQSGQELTVSFQDLAKHVGGDKNPEEIAEELHEGENVQVFMRGNKIERITY